MRLRFTSLVTPLAILVVALSLFVLPRPAAAQGPSGPPTEPTIAQLREGLQLVLGIERQRQLLGVPSDPAILEQALHLLTREFDENVLPGLTSVLDDCFFAEIPLQRATEWVRQVQLRGFAEELGPLYNQARQAQDLTIQVLKNCHDQLYKACVMNDADPSLDALGGLSRQLALFGVEGDGAGSYQERWLRCEVGWHGTLKITERVTGASRMTFPSAPGTSVVHTQDTGGNRTVTIELPNKKQPTTGHVQARLVQTTRQETVTPNCRETLINEHETAAGGEGTASLTKGIMPDGTLLLNFAGPHETGYATIGGRNISSCGGSGELPKVEMPSPAGAWRGVLSERMDDPYAEVLAGTKTFTWVVNAAGGGTPGRTTPGGDTIRVPAIPGAAGLPGLPGLPGMPGLPGAPIVIPGELASPWLLGRVQPPLGDSPADFPVVTMEITWNLQFG